MKKKVPFFVNDVNNEGGYAHVRAGGIWEISVCNSQLCFKPETALKIKCLKMTFWGKQYTIELILNEKNILNISSYIK